MNKLALMFPGQGSQAVGMGCDLCAAYPQMRETYAEASDVLEFDLESICAMGPAEALARTDVTQPALLANSIGIFRILTDEGLRFDAAFGHSLGEYSALVATGRAVVRRRAAPGAAARPGDAARRRGRTPAAWPPSSASTTRRSRSLRRRRRRLAGQLQQPRPGRGERHEGRSGRPGRRRPRRPAPAGSSRWP